MASVGELARFVAERLRQPQRARPLLHGKRERAVSISRRRDRENNLSTGALIQERRADIVYGWNDTTQGMRLVFEFKRMGRQKKHRNHYLLEQGLGRFVTGIYSRRQAVAAMVGVLLDPEADVVPPIREALEDAALATALRLKPTSGGDPIARPSNMFRAADFDTEHERDPSLAPTHGTIRVSHFFLAFGYPTSTLKLKTT
ncbi:hypothetical protein [Bradyrhizobium sp. S3.2.12]|uniref:hypothetical protein n=1 Tax=unclassified Bradyrhizobium TaxID=2631580 RepID=UPI0033970454